MTDSTRRDALALIGGAASAVYAGVASAAQSGAVTPEALSIDRRPTPSGVTAPRPRFSWTLASRNPTGRNLAQSAYRVQVSEDWPAGAKVLDSGRVEGSAMALTPDVDLRLKPQTPYAWRVMVWDQDGAPSAWSAPQRFTTGAALPWRGHWIALQPDGAITAPEIENQERPASAYALPLLRRGFRIDKPVRHAVACVSGLGCYNLSVNGVDASPALMNPGWTDYAKTVLYNTLDLTDLLAPGENVLGVALGDGMYDVQSKAGRYSKWAGSFGAPKLILQLHIVYQDGSEDWIASDDRWQASAGPVTFASIYGGEDYDARLAQKDWDRPGAAPSGWAPALATTRPAGVLTPQQTPGMVVAETFKTVTITTPAPGVQVHDLGQNFSGRPVLAVRGTAGAVVRIKPGELLDAHGRVTQVSMAADPDHALLFTYTLSGDEGVQVWRPRFSYSGFRYLEVEVRGEADVAALDGEFLHADLPSAGDFACSDARLNRTHDLIRRAVLSNTVAILTDCPHREKLGWLEQTYLNAGTIFYNVQALPLYDKMAGDIADAQTPSGMVPSIAPEYVRFIDDKGADTDFRSSPEWGSASIQSPWAAYRFTGDLALLHRAYPTMRRYNDYLSSRSCDGLVNFGLGDWYDIGPGEPGEPKLSSKTFVGSATWFADLIVLAKVAKLIGDGAGAARFTAQAAALKATINAKLFDPATARYDRGSQTAYAMALALGLVPDGFEARVLANFVHSIQTRADHVSAGDIGFHYVVQALTASCRGDLLYAMATQASPPSYAAQIAAGATALTEAWDASPNHSQNHFMLGHIEQWLFGGLAGLDIDYARCERDAIRIAPEPVAGVTSARASHIGPFGKVSVDWAIRENVFSLTVDLPPNSTALVRLPNPSHPPVRVGSGRRVMSCSIAKSMGEYAGGRGAHGTAGRNGALPLTASQAMLNQ
jgi:hypothetical protein